MYRQLLSGLSLALLGSAMPGHPAQPAGTADPARIRMIAAQDLPPLDGEHLRARLIEVSYGPGGSSSPHTHACAVMGYVLEGALRTQVKGEPEVVYHSGESFYEAPNGVHLVSANASEEAPVRFLAYFTCDADVPLAAPVSESGPAPKP